jgi:hypothetical protein
LELVGLVPQLLALVQTVAHLFTEWLWLVAAQVV